MKKILVIRFSSIGDIVLTTPVLRCLKSKFPDCEIDYLTKRSFGSVIASNPYVSNVITIDKEVKEVAAQLKKSDYDFVVDLHKNIRSKQTKNIVKAPNQSFAKLNWEKWLLTNFKINKMPNEHIVDRYLDTVSELGVVNDNEGLDFFISTKNEVTELPFDNYVAFVVGAAHATKALSFSKMVEILDRVDQNFILIGGPGDKEKANQVLSQCKNANVFNACGNYNLEQSASLLKQSNCVITPDTGMMHIASALNKPVISVWGNTVPEFGMYPYIPKNEALVHIVEVKELKCRPCSKIGHPKCPKKHFQCIEDIDVNEVKKLVELYASN